MTANLTAEEKKKREADILERSAKERADFDAEKAEKAGFFDPRQFIGLTTDVQTVPDPELGLIRYKYLTTSDFLGLRDAKEELGDEEMAQRAMWLMMNKANPDFTFEDFKALPQDVSTRLILALTPKISFLKQIRTTPSSRSSVRGSSRAQRPKR